MNNKWTYAIILAAAGIGSSALAQEKTNYVEGAFGQLTYEESGYSLTPTIGRLVVGGKVADNLALEVMGAAGFGSSTVGVVTLKVNNAFGAYAKPYIKINEKVELFGRLGFTRASLTASGPGATISTSGGDVSYGIGIGVEVAENISLVADYMSYYDKSSISIKGWSVGAKFGF